MLWLFFVGFIVMILGFIALDLGLIGSKAHVISVREALLRTLGWVSLAMAFNVLVYFMYEHHWLGIGQHMRNAAGQVVVVPGAAAAEQFFTGYLLEYSLSMDNMFVIATIFAYFNIPLIHQHRVLFWGIMGALILRGIMITLGVVIVAKFSWVLYIFGALLILTAVKMAFSKSEEIHPSRNIVVRLARRMYPVTASIEGSHFFADVTRPDGKVMRAMTPLFLALILVETSDVMFAVDSIPAIFIITQDPFIIFTSNVFAICGLRSLYFALAGLMDKFRYLKASVVFLLAYIGVKMLISLWEHIPTRLTLVIVVSALAIGVIASVAADRMGKKHHPDNGTPRL